MIFPDFQSFNYIIVTVIVTVPLSVRMYIKFWVAMPGLRYNNYPKLIITIDLWYILNDTRPAMCMALADFFCNHDNQFLYSIFPFNSTIPIPFHSSESSGCTCMHHDHDSACMDFSIKACDCGEIYIKFSIFFKISNRLVKVIDGQLILNSSVYYSYISKYGVSEDSGCSLGYLHVRAHGKRHMLRL